jgi:hypothetical protein
MRKNECPAYGKKCDACGRLNHFEAVCRSKDKPNIMQLNTPNSGIQGTEDAIFDTLCTTTDRTPQARAIALDHHTYSEFNDSWVGQPSKPQPYINITVTSQPEGYRALEFEPPMAHLKEVQLSAMSDTECQSCLVSMKVR